VQGPPTLAIVQENWEQVPEELKRMRRLPVGAFVREAWPVALEQNTLTVCFPPDFEFHYRQVSTTYRPVIEEALERLFGAKLALACRLGEVDKTPQPAQQPAPDLGASAPEPQGVPAGQESGVPQPAEQQPGVPQPAAQEPVAGGAPTAAEAVPEPAAAAETSLETGSQPAPEVSPPAEQASQPADRRIPAQGSPVLDSAVARTLELFEGSEVMGDDE
jgi:hypothetical protein